MGTDVGLHPMVVFGIIVSVLSFALFVFLVWHYWASIKSETAVGPSVLPSFSKTIPAQGIAVPVVATFTGFKPIPVLSLAHNSGLGSRLRLFEDKIEYFVLTNSTARLSDIEEVDVDETIATESAVISFRTSPFTFAANFYRKENLKAVLQYFKQRNVKLTQKAEKVLASPPNAPPPAYPNAPQPAGVRITTDRNSYATGDQIRVTILNDLPYPIFLQGCNQYSIIRLIGVARKSFAFKDCFWEGHAVKLDAGKTFSDSFPASAIVGSNSFRAGFGYVTGCKESQTFSECSKSSTEVRMESELFTVA